MMMRETSLRHIKPLSDALVLIVPKPERRVLRRQIDGGASSVNALLWYSLFEYKSPKHQDTPEMNIPDKVSAVF